MAAATPAIAKSYAKCIEVSKRVRWDMDKDVFRGRDFSANEKYLPDGITEMVRFDFLDGLERRLMSQVQGHTYATMFGFEERFITVKMLELTRNYWLDDQVALEALVRFCDEEIKHQSMFVRIEQMLSRTMPGDHVFHPDPNEVAKAVLEMFTWAVLGVILENELFTQVHFKASIATDPELSELYKDVFLFHWKEETTHAIVDELEWPRVDGGLSTVERDRAVDDLIAIVSDFDWCGPLGGSARDRAGRQRLHLRDGLPGPRLLAHPHPQRIAGSNALKSKGAHPRTRPHGLLRRCRHVAGVRIRHASSPRAPWWRPVASGPASGRFKHESSMRIVSLPCKALAGRMSTVTG